MIKKITTLLAISTLFTGFSSYASEDDETECFLFGEVKLPSHYFDDSIYVNLFSQESEIDKYGNYCIKEKPQNRNELKLQVFYNNNLLLENTIVYRGKKSTKHNITLEQAMAEVTCREDICTQAQIKKNIQSPYIKEYVEKKVLRYYKRPEKVDYEKIIKKMSQQDRNVRNSTEKTIKNESKNNFKNLKDEMRATDYNKFTYKKRDVRKYEMLFMEDNTPIEGLTSKDMPVDIMVIQWARMAFFHGNDLKKAGRFYTKEYKDKLKENDDFHEPLKLTALYKNKTKSNSKIRDKTDEMYFKKSVKAVKGMFKKRYGVIINDTPTYVNIEFIFENGSWRLNQLDINKKYLNSIQK